MEFLLSNFIFDKKKCEHQKQGEIAENHREAAKMIRHQCANAGTEDEKNDHTIVLQGFFAFDRIFRLSESEEQLRPAAKIAGTHSRCIGQIMNFTKTLHLQGADERNQNIGNQVMVTA